MIPGIPTDKLMQYHKHNLPREVLERHRAAQVDEPFPRLSRQRQEAAKPEKPSGWQRIEYVIVAGLVIVAALAICWQAKGQPAPCVWAQPSNSFAGWKAAGVGMVFDYPRNFDVTITSDGVNPIPVAQWVDAAANAGLDVALPWNSATIPLIVGPAARKNVKSVIVANDEPNGSGGQTPDQCQRNRDAIRAAGYAGRLAIDLDFAACRWQDDAMIAGYCAAADDIFGDLYPYNRGEGLAGVVDLVAQVQRTIRLSGGKNVTAWIETSDQVPAGHEIKGSWIDTLRKQGKDVRGPTVNEYRNTLLAVLNAGAFNWGIFPDQVGGDIFAFDGTTPEIRAAITAKYGPPPSVTHRDPIPVPAPPATQPVVPAPATQPALPDVLHIEGATYKKAA